MNFLPQDIACWLELAVEVEPQHWSVYLEWMLASPEMTLSFFLEVIDWLKTSMSCGYIREFSETLVGILMENPEEAHASRGEPWLHATMRLCKNNGSLEAYIGQVQEYFPEKKQRFDKDLARYLHRQGYPVLAGELVAKIDDPETRLILELEQGLLPGRLQLKVLFERLADTSVLEDELQALQGTVSDKAAVSWAVNMCVRVTSKMFD